MPLKKKVPRIAYEFKTGLKVPPSITEPLLYPPPVTIGKSSIEFHALPTSKEMGKLEEKDRITILGLIVTPAAHNTLNHFVSSGDWLSGVIMAASILEFVGKTRLLWKFERTISKDKIQNMDLEDVITFLFASNVITQSTYTKMHQIRRGRNKIVHHPNNLYDLMFEKKSAIESAKTIISKAHECLNLLAPSHRPDRN